MKETTPIRLTPGRAIAVACSIVLLVGYVCYRAVTTRASQTAAPAAAAPALPQPTGSQSGATDGVTIEANESMVLPGSKSAEVTLFPQEKPTEQQTMSGTKSGRVFTPDQFEEGWSVRRREPESTKDH